MPKNTKCNAHDSRMRHGESEFFACAAPSAQSCPYDYCVEHCKDRCTENDHEILNARIG